jgi:hypothetical protein
MVKKTFLIAGLLAASVLVCAGAMQDSPDSRIAAASVVPATTQSTHREGAIRQAGFDPRARKFYNLIWGVDAFRVKSVESGEMIRFSFAVLDANKAAPLNDKQLNPSLIDEAKHVALVIPTLEKVGQLRQTGTPEAGRSYWMVFSNKGSVVKPGDRVSVVIGKFRVDGLIVE